MDRVDIAIVGTGPAGLSAAITATIRNKKILLFGKKELSLKVTKAHKIFNYLGIPQASGEKLGEAFKQHIADMNIEITEERVTSIYNMGDFFAIQTPDSMYEAKSIIIATGVIMSKPYPKEEELLGKGVSYCATCDAPLYRGKTIAIIGETKKEEDEVRFMGEVAQKVYYIPLYDTDFIPSRNISVIKEKPVEIIGEEKVEAIKTMSNSTLAAADVDSSLAPFVNNEYKIDGLFILRESISPNQLIYGIEMQGGHVVVDRQMNTSIPGVFACGDITGVPYQYIKAAGEGNVAAISAALYVDKQRKI